MLLLILGLILFFAPHFVSIVNDPWRNRMAERVGAQSWKALYSAVSLAGLMLMIWGYGAARTDSTVLYVPPVWLH